MSKISACLVIFNEEKILSRCLESLKVVVDEIIIVHDGECSDSSLNIAREYNAKVFIRPHFGESEAHRSFSFEQATGDWILPIDADELLPGDTQRIIPELIKDDKVDAYYFRWSPTDGKKVIGRAFTLNTKMFLLRKSKMYMVGITHEFSKTYGVESQRPDVLVEHYPNYNNFTIDKMRTKWFKWGKIQAKQILDLPTASTFGVPDITRTREYGFYCRMINHPFRVTLKYSYDVAQKVFVDIARNPMNPFDWQSWKILLLNTINYLYLGWHIYKYRQKVPKAMQWWTQEVVL